MTEDAEATAPGSRSTEPALEREVSPRYLLVFEARSSFMFPLPARGEVEIGRGSEGLRLEAASVSRRHAKLVIGDAVTLVDLGSQNGTRVNGELVVGARELAAADMITIGGATLVYHADQRVEVTSPVLELPELRRRIDEEIERVLRFKRSFGLLCVSLEPRPGGALSARLDEGIDEGINSALQRQLRKLDLCAWVGELEVIVLLPETDAAETPLTAARLRDALRELHPGIRIGHATAPDDDCEADALLAGVRRAALATSPGTCAPAGRTVRALEISGRTVVVADVAMVRLYAMIDRLAGSDLPVLITGETGSGKEIAATALHLRSPRHTRPLVTLNCAAIQESLVESELFGYERGAFSGAVSAKPGLLEAASGGTVFLDEIGELTAPAQAKLLRAVETRRITRLGDVREREIDLRLVTATNRDLSEELDAGRFRRDLYFRLSAAVLWIPPLRERPVEVPLLAQAFLDEACARLGRSAMRISPTALAILRAHHWPGNLRELKNLMDYVAAAFTDAAVEPRHIADRVRSRREPPAPREALAAPPTAPPIAPPAERRYASLADEIAELERRRIGEALAASGGNHALAARSIGMPLRTFFSKVKKYKL